MGVRDNTKMNNVIKCQVKHHEGKYSSVKDYRMIWVLFLDKVVKEGFPEEVPFAQQHAWTEAG